MTAADHANTVRARGTSQYLVGAKSSEYLLITEKELDALQAQLEAVEKRHIVTTTVQGDTHMNRLRERAEAAEAERDRLADALRGLNEAALAFYEHALPHEEMFNGQDHDRFVALDNALSIARAALDRTEHP